MRLDDADLRHLADLARLELIETEQAALRHDLSRLIGYLAQLQAVDVDAVDPMHRPLDEAAPERAAGAAALTRGDVVDERRALAPEALEALAPALHEGRVRVARTVDEAG